MMVTRHQIHIFCPTMFLGILQEKKWDILCMLHHCYEPQIWSIIAGLSPQVVKTMEKLTVESKPFALKDKYVPAISAARAAAGQEEMEEPEDEEACDPPAKRKAKDMHPNGEPWDFAGVRSAYMKNQKAQGLSFKDAKQSWDQSDEKRLYLKDVSVKELKRRKFIPKGCKTNPWA